MTEEEALGDRRIGVPDARDEERGAIGKTGSSQSYRRREGRGENRDEDFVTRQGDWYGKGPVGVSREGAVGP